MKLFDFYTESNCKLECAWNKSLEVCGCKPWHVPSDDNTQTCFILGNVCFEQIMKKIAGGELELTCDCSEDCIYSRYTMSVLDRTILERTSVNIFNYESFGTTFPIIGTDQVIGNDFSKTNWYNMGKFETDSNQWFNEYPWFRRVCEGCRVQVVAPGENAGPQVPPAGDGERLLP